jgi:LuxR family maltose regulon positive regulatory protein
MKRGDLRSGSRDRGRPIIDRPRLLDLLEDEARVIHLLAPAGYGKTTLLRQWHRRHPEAYWFTADGGASDVARLAMGLALALQRVRPGLPDRLGQVLLALTNPEQQVDRIVDTFYKAMNGTPALDVVIDDYQFMSSNPLSEKLVCELRARLTLRLLIGSRVRPNWATAREQIYGETVDIGAEDLAFTAAETSEVLQGPRLIRSTLLRNAGGWPAVVGLAALSESSAPGPHDTASQDLFAFFAEELFAAVPEGLRYHLETMALAPSLELRLAEEMFGVEAAAVLERSVESGFVTFVGEEYELHPLIREFLLSKLVLSDDSVSRVADAFALSVRIAAWDHAFALVTQFVRLDLLAEYVERSFKPLIRSGRVRTLQHAADFARSKGMAFMPLVALIDAELALRAGNFRRAVALGARAAGALGNGHSLTSYACHTAGLAALLASDYEAAHLHLRRAKATARDDEDVREALYGLLLTSVTSESQPDEESLASLHARKDN